MNKIKAEADLQYQKYQAQYQAAGGIQPTISTFTIPFEDFMRMSFRDNEQMMDYLFGRARMFSLIQPGIEYEVSLIMEGTSEVRVAFRPGRVERERLAAIEQEKCERKMREMRAGMSIPQFYAQSMAESMARSIDKSILKEISEIAQKITS